MNKPDAFEMMLMAAGIFIPIMFMQVHLSFFTITIVEVMTMLLTVTFILRVVRNNLDLTLTTVDMLFLLLFCWAALSVPKSIDISKTWREIMLLFESSLIFYMVSHGIKEQEEFRRILRFWCYGCAMVSVLGILQFVLLVKSGLQFLGYDHGFLSVALRINSTIPHANSLSGYLVIFIPIMLAFIYETKKDKRIFWTLLTGFTVSALIFTYTRAGWFASVASIFLLVYLLKDKRLLTVLAVCLAVFCLAFPNVITRTASLLSLSSDLGSLQRIQLWEAALLMWRDNPLTGVGVGNYFHLLMDYVNHYPYLNQIFEPIEPHNSFIKVLVETGVPGFILFTVLIVTLLRKALQLHSFYLNKPQNTVVSGIISGGLAFLLQSNTNSLFHEQRVAVAFWIMAGLLYAFSVKSAVHPMDG